MTMITRWDPVNTLARFQDEMTRFFEEPMLRGFRTPTSLTV